MDKNSLRTVYKAKLKLLTLQEQAEYSNQICQSLLKYFASVRNKNILVYQPMKAEPDISNFIQEITALNRIYFPNKEVLEIASISGEILDFELLDYAIVPALSVSRAGKRLGRGGGWYDRLLAKATATSICPIFDLQLAIDLPEEGHDKRIDIIMTESNIINCR